MLCKIRENNLEKCHKYWPDRHDAPREGGKIKVILQEEEKFDYFTRRKFLLTDADDDDAAGDDDVEGAAAANFDKKQVTQFHFTDWPDFGVPAEQIGFLELIDRVREKQGDSSGGPMAVHCSAGIGRTGSFCLAFACGKKVRAEGKRYEFHEVFNMLARMRTMRAGLIQTPEQLRFTFGAIKKMEEAHLERNKATPTSGEATKKRKKSDDGDHGDHGDDEEHDQEIEEPNSKKTK